MYNKLKQTKWMVVLTFFLVATLINYVPRGFSEKPNERGGINSLGPAVVLREEVIKALPVCALADYYIKGTSTRGWPFVAYETVDDPCGAYYKQNFSDVYPLSMVVNSLAVFIPLSLVLGTVKKARKRLKNE